MFDVKISITILLLALTISDAQVRTPEKIKTDPYEIEGDWYVIAVANLRKQLFQPACWKITIAKPNRTTFDGFSAFFNRITQTTIVKQFTGTRSKEFLYPNVFDILVRNDDVRNRGLQLSLFNGYMNNYTILEWDIGSGKIFDSLIVSRKVKLPQTETDTLRKTYPNLEFIENKVSDACVSFKARNTSRSIAPADDPFKLKHVWYIVGYQANRTLGRIRCWIVNMKTSSPTVYTGTSAFLTGRNREIMAVSFSATQYGDWTHVPKFHITLNGVEKKSIKIVPIPSYIYSYSYWVSYGDEAPFEYLVASTNPILTPEEFSSLDIGNSGYYEINNTRSALCRSRPMRLPGQINNSTNANNGTLENDENREDEEDGEEENLSEIEMFTRDEKSSPAHRPDIEIRVVFLSVLLCIYFLASPP